MGPSGVFCVRYAGDIRMGAGRRPSGGPFQVHLPEAHPDGGEPSGGSFFQFGHPDAIRWALSSLPSGPSGWWGAIRWGLFLFPVRPSGCSAALHPVGPVNFTIRMGLRKVASHPVGASSFFQFGHPDAHPAGPVKSPSGWASGRWGAIRWVFSFFKFGHPDGRAPPAIRWAPSNLPSGWASGRWEPSGGWACFLFWPSGWGLLIRWALSTLPSGWASGRWGAIRWDVSFSVRSSAWTSDGRCSLGHPVGPF